MLQPSERAPGLLLGEGVELFAVPRAFYVGAGYERVRVHGVYREDGGEAGHQGPEGEPLAQAAQHGQDEPDEDDGDPEHKNSGVQA